MVWRKDLRFCDWQDWPRTFASHPGLVFLNWNETGPGCPSFFSFFQACDSLVNHPNVVPLNLALDPVCCDGPVFCTF